MATQPHLTEPPCNDSNDQMHYKLGVAKVAGPIQVKVAYTARPVLLVELNPYGNGHSRRSGECSCQSVSTLENKIG